MIVMVKFVIMPEILTQLVARRLDGRGNLLPRASIRTCKQH
jgi:hypothetical protein